MPDVIRHPVVYNVKRDLDSGFRRNDVCKEGTTPKNYPCIEKGRPQCPPVSALRVHQKTVGTRLP